jgi:16S rRNA (cytosine1402-N4)-methyltransferase
LENAVRLDASSINSGLADLKVNSSPVVHIPVLAETLAERINLPRDGVMVDATIGQGGHSLLFGSKLGPEGVLIGLDVDKESIQRAHYNLKGLSCKVILIRANFSQIREQLSKQGVEKVDFILADLGLCSAHLANVRMGLSFQIDSLLDMRIDERLKTTAADIVNETPEKDLADLIYRFGQDRASRQIARLIVRHRQSRPITTTGQLAAVVCKALQRPGRKKWTRIHPATRTFQALRIAVNNELENLEKLLNAAPEILNKKGKIAVISFHSLEDRLVKNNFKQNRKENIYCDFTKKPIVPSRQEIESNPRARSAKLRIAQKT